MGTVVFIFRRSQQVSCCYCRRSTRSCCWDWISCCSSWTLLKLSVRFGLVHHVVRRPAEFMKNGLYMKLCLPLCLGKAAIIAETEVAVQRPRGRPRPASGLRTRPDCRRGHLKANFRAFMIPVFKVLLECLQAVCLLSHWPLLRVHQVVC